MLRSYLRTYSKKSTVHGVAYLGQSRTNIVEKLVWVVCLIVSLILTGLLISQLIGRLNKTPIVVSLDDTPIRVSEIFFPSVTICSGLFPWVNGTDYNKLLDEIKSGEKDLANLTQRELEYMQIVSLIAKDDYLTQFTVPISTENFIDRLSEFSKFVENYARDKGNWNKKKRISFSEIIGRNGFCYTFNFPTSEKHFKLEELSSDFNFVVSSLFDTDIYNLSRLRRTDYPLQTENSDLGLTTVFYERRTVTIGNYPNANYVQWEPMHLVENGFRLTFHHPFEMISTDSPNYFALFNQTILFRIRPRKTSFDSSISMFNLKQRRCYLPEEKTLKFFKIYNSINCEHECLANLTLDDCGCVQFFMVRNQSTTICGIADMKCFGNVETKFSTTKSKCKCYNLCDRLSYEIEVVCLNREYSIKSGTIATFEVKFRENEIYQHIYKMHYSYTDMMAFLGGLLGLFAGLSALSVVEVIYFFSVRLMLQRCSSVVYPESNETTSSNFLSRFMEQTGIHSFNFVIWEDSKIKKLFWIVAFAVSIYSFQSMAFDSYRKFSLNAVATIQDNELMSVEQIPLPAITFMGASEHSYKPLDDFLYTDQYDFEESEREYQRLQFVNLRTIVELFLCLDLELYWAMEDYSFNYSRHSDFVDMLMNISLSSQRIWFVDRKAEWKGKTNFFESLTPNGIAFTFNTFRADEILKVGTVSDDFIRIQRNTESWTYDPWKISAAEDFSVSFTSNSHLIRDSKQNDRCHDAGFFMHSPYEMPLTAKEKSFTKLNYGTLMEILVKPEVIKSDESLRQMDLEHRKCYFEGEHPLKYFKHYTKSHCDLEVLSAITFEKCGCVLFNYIRNASMDICDISQWPCADDLTYVVFDGRDNTEFSRHCLPTCDQVTYEYEFITSREAVNYSRNSFEETTLSVRFKDSEVIVQRRYQLYPAITLLSNIGGLLGLFAGISFLTLLETFYLLIIRPITDLTRKIFCVH